MDLDIDLDIDEILNAFDIDELVRDEQNQKIDDQSQTSNTQNSNCENSNRNYENLNVNCESSKNENENCGITNKNCKSSNNNEKENYTDFIENCESSSKEKENCGNINENFRSSNNNNEKEICGNLNEKCESTSNNNEKEKCGNLNEAESDAEPYSKCYCPMLLLNGFPKTWTAFNIRRYLEFHAGLKGYYVRTIKSPVHIKRKLVEGCLLEFITIQERSAAVRNLEGLFVEGVPLETSIFTQKMKGKMLKQTGQDIICMNKGLVKKPVHEPKSLVEINNQKSIYKKPESSVQIKIVDINKLKTPIVNTDINRTYSKLVIRSLLKRDLSKISDNSAENSPNKKAKTDNGNNINGFTKSMQSKNDVCSADPFNTERILWRPTEMMNETFALSKDFLERLGISLPLSKCIIVKNVNPLVTEEHIDKLKAIFSLAGNIEHMLITTGPSKRDTCWSVVYSHPLEVVQPVSMFDKQKICNRVVTVTLDRCYNRNQSLEEIYLPEGLQSIGPWLGPNGVLLTYEPIQDTFKSIYLALQDPSKCTNDPIHTGKSTGEISKDIEVKVKIKDKFVIDELEEGELPDDNHSNKDQKKIDYEPNMEVLRNLYCQLKLLPILKQETALVLQRHLWNLAFIVSQKTVSGKKLMGNCLLTTVMGIEVHPQPNSRDPRVAATIMAQKETTDQLNLEVLSDLSNQLKLGPKLRNETAIALRKQLLNLALVVSQKTGNNVPEQFKKLIFLPESTCSNVQNQPTPSEKQIYLQINPLKNQVDTRQGAASSYPSTVKLPDSFECSKVFLKEDSDQQRLIRENKLRELQMNTKQQMKKAKKVRRKINKAIMKAKKQVTLPWAQPKSNSNTVTQNIQANGSPSQAQQRPANVTCDPDVPTLKFSGIPPSVTGHDWQNKMRQVGELAFCWMLGSGRAMVRFKRKEEVDRCYKLFNRAEIDGQVIAVQYDFPT